MKIDINKVPYDGLTLEEDIAAARLDLDTEIIKLQAPVRVTGNVSKIANAVSVELSINATLTTSCSRCLKEFDIQVKKDLKLNYPAYSLEPIIDTSTSRSVNGERNRFIELDQDIREELILDYPLTPLCGPGCKGLCPKCGKNLNEGGCPCGST